MSATPAARLARLKTQYRSWRIERNPDPHRAGFTATSLTDTKRTITAVSVTELEAALIEAEGQ